MQKEKPIKLTDVLFLDKNNRISIELLPNKPVNLNKLKQLQPQFCSVTWHQDPSNLLPENIPSIQLCRKITNIDLPVLLHIAVRNLTKEKALEILDYLKKTGIRNLLIVQGDATTATNNDKGYYDFQYAVDFIRFIKTNFDSSYFCIGVAAYPETEQNFDYFRSKASVADFIITQATFNYEALLEFRNKCKALAISIPIVVGIFIIDSAKAVTSVKKFCGVPIPEKIMQFVQSGDEVLIKEFGMQVAVDLVKKITGPVHVFSMNNFDLYEGIGRAHV